MKKKAEGADGGGGFSLRGRNNEKQRYKLISFSGDIELKGERGKVGVFELRAVRVCARVCCWGID